MASRGASDGARDPQRAGVKGFVVRYYDGGTDVTSAVVQGTYSTGSLPPGSYVSIGMTVRIANSVRSGTVRSWLIQVSSHGVADWVNAKVSVV